MSNSYDEYYNERNDKCKKDKHVHEFTGSTKLAERGDERHNHRTAGITSEPIFCENGRHFHIINADTDSAPDEDHHHPIRVRTGLDIKIRGTDKHVHSIKGATRVREGHCHNFEFATLTENPLE